MHVLPNFLLNNNMCHHILIALYDVEMQIIHTAQRVTNIAFKQYRVTIFITEFFSV